MVEVKTPRKLIEVALPLDAINEAAAKEKSIRHGHPSTLHLWWARRPLAAARAVIFAQMVNDPGYERHLGRGVNKEKAAKERERLFGIVERLVKWENTNNEEVLNEAREEIRKSWQETCALNKTHPQATEFFNPEKLPAFHDPFAGGGALPLEAQRLGLEAWASDLNPVAVIINKAMIEIPPKFTGRRPVGPVPAGEKQSTIMEDWSGAKGLAEDVRRYGIWMQEEAKKRIGDLYPQVEITDSMALERTELQALVGEKFTVIAWLWVRTVKSPNPAYSHIDVPLVRSFWVSTKEGRETWVQPVLSADNSGYDFKIRNQGTPQIDGTIGRQGGLCIMSGSPIPLTYIRNEARSGRMGIKLMAIVADGPHGRIFLPPTIQMETVAESARPQWKPDVKLPLKHRNFQTPGYGMENIGDLFTPRQILALTTLADLAKEVRIKAVKDAIAYGWIDDHQGLNEGGSNAKAYADAIATLLALAVSRSANTVNALTVWSNSREQSVNLFSRQAIPMAWDFPETNPFSGAAGDFGLTTKSMARTLIGASSSPAHVLQADAQKQTISSGKVISTDPPYYDNISYGELSDFFYVWLRRAIKNIFPELFSTIAVPKEEELIASPGRHGGKEQAEEFFLQGMTEALRNLAIQAHPAFPTTIYYAFKQSDTTDSITSNTGWETFLEAVLRSGFAISGTWPMRTERPTGVKTGMNALASSIILVCRKRDNDAPVVPRREFIRELNMVLPDALDEMTQGGVNSPVAPVDLSQAIIGPGMAIFSRYAAVLEADGTPMTVRTALQLINRFFAEDDFDHDTQFCLSWFENSGWSEGQFGQADVLARSKGTSVGGLQAAGVAQSSGGNFRLLRWAELPADWSPVMDKKASVWEGLHQLIRALNQEGEAAAGQLLAGMPALAESMRALAYRLYTLCERKGWAEEARAYNELVGAWTGIEQVSYKVGHVGTQTELDM